MISFKERHVQYLIRKAWVEEVKDFVLRHTEFNVHRLSSDKEIGRFLLIEFGENKIKC